MDCRFVVYIFILTKICWISVWKEIIKSESITYKSSSSSPSSSLPSLLFKLRVKMRPRIKFQTILSTKNGKLEVPSKLIFNKMPKIWRLSHSLAPMKVCCKQFGDDRRSTFLLSVILPFQTRKATRRAEGRGLGGFGNKIRLSIYMYIQMSDLKRESSELKPYSST